MTNQFVEPTSPVDLQKIQDAIIEASNSLVRIDSEKDHKKAIADKLKQELGVPPRLFNKWVKTYHKQEYQKVVNDNEEFSESYAKIMRGKDEGVDE